MKTITNWSVGIWGQEFTPPEYQQPRIQGTLENGTNIMTSAAVKAEGRIITTTSGSMYVLVGEPHFEYLTWLRVNGYDYNENDPIGMGRGSRKIKA